MLQYLSRLGESFSADVAFEGLNSSVSSEVIFDIAEFGKYFATHPTFWDSIFSFRLGIIISHLNDWDAVNYCHKLLSRGLNRRICIRLSLEILKLINMLASLIDLAIHSISLSIKRGGSRQISNIWVGIPLDASWKWVLLTPRKNWALGLKLGVMSLIFNILLATFDVDARVAAKLAVSWLLCCKDLEWKMRRQVLRILGVVSFLITSYHCPRGIHLVGGIDLTAAPTIFSTQL